MATNMLLNYKIERNKKIMLYVRIYEKDNKRKAYLYIDLGYAKRVLSWDMALCAEVLQISVHELYYKECGEYQVC